MNNDQFIFYKNLNIHYCVSGSSKPVLLIHGFGEDGNIWNYLEDKLKSNYCVIIPDLPGSGKSEILKENSGQISIDDYAEVIMQILKNESVNKCTIIGHSMGGYITLAIAEKHPEVLNGFGFFNSTAFADTEEKKKDRLKTMQFLQENDAVTFLKTSIPSLFADKFKQEQPEEIEQLIDSVKYFTNEALIQYTSAMMNRTEKINVLKTTALPVLFIIGEDDPVIPLEKSLTQCYLPDVSFVHIIPDTAHMSMLEEKDVSAEIVLSYLNDLYA